jgi:hypothetical protein
MGSIKRNKKSFSFTDFLRMKFSFKMQSDISGICEAKFWGALKENAMVANC